MTDQPYEKWLAERREVSPPATLTDQIMSHVAELESQRRDLWWLARFSGSNSRGPLGGRCAAKR